MKIKTSQAGFSHLAILLIVLVLSAVGFVGWRVYQNNQADKPQQAVAPVSEAPTDVEEEACKATAGYTRYANEDLGFCFAYPEEWGEASTKAGPETSHLTSGEEYAITFSKNSNIFAGANTEDWEHDPLKGHGGLPNSAGFKEYKKISAADFGETLYVIRFSTNTKQLYAFNTEFNFTGVEVIADRKFDNNKANLAGLQIKLNIVNESMDIQSQKPETVVSTKQFKQLETLLDSITAL